MLTPDDKLATYALDDPGVDGVACYDTIPERGGERYARGCRGGLGYLAGLPAGGPVRIKEKFEQGEVVFRSRGR